MRGGPKRRLGIGGGLKMVAPQRYDCPYDCPKASIPGAIYRSWSGNESLFLPARATAYARSLFD
jgi:hypothetical protein